MRSILDWVGRKPWVGLGVVLALILSIGAWIAPWGAFAARIGVSERVARYFQQGGFVSAIALLLIIATYASRGLGVLPEFFVRRRGLPLTLLAGGMALYVLSYGYFTFQRHYHFNSAAYDLGLQTQVVWNTAQGKWFACSYEVSNYLGDHFQPLMALLAPLYRLSPSVYWLLAFQTVVLALAAIPLYRLATHRLESRWAGLVFAGAYLLFPPVGYVNRFDFHWEVTAVFTLLAAIESAERGAWQWTSFWLALSLLGKEEIGLTVAVLGLWLAWRKKRPGFGLAWTGIGLTFSLAALFILIPAFRGGPSDTIGRYQWLGASPLKMIETAALNPGLILGRLFNVDGIRYDAGLLGPWAGLPLLSPLGWVGLPAWGYNLLSDMASQRSIYFQHVTPLIPVMAAGAVYGAENVLKWARRRGWPWLRPALLAVVLLFAVWHMGWVNNPLTDDGTVRAAWQRQPNAPAVRAALALVPPEADVFTTNHYAPHLSHRRRIQIPFEVSDAGYLAEADTAFFNLRDLRGPGLADWTCLDYRGMLEIARGYDYGVVFSQDGAVLLQRGAGDRPALAELVGTMCGE